MARLLHVTTTDMSLDWLLRPQLLAFAAAGYEVWGVSAPGPHVAALERSGIRHVAVPHLTRAMRPAWDLRALGELRRVFTEVRPDIVHTHNPKPGLLGPLAARSARVPVVVNTVHGVYATEEDGVAARALTAVADRVTAGLVGAQLVQNPEDVPTLERFGVPRSKVVLVGNGIDLGRFRAGAVPDERRRRLRAEVAADDDPVLCGAVGRLVREKGYVELFDAVARAREEVPALRLVVVGPDEPDKADAIAPEVRARAEDRGVRFVGARDDVEGWYRAFDLYVLASHREGFPRSAMEAAAMGLPIVATDIRGCRQVVEDGRTGILVPPRNAAALSRALVALARDPHRRERFGRAGAEKARQEFDQQAVIDTTLQVYDRLRRRSATSV